MGAGNRTGQPDPGVQATLHRPGHQIQPFTGQPAPRPYSRRALIALLAAVPLARAQGGDAIPVFFRRTEVQTIRQAFAQQLPALARESQVLQHDASACLQRGPWSVTDERPRNTPAEPNDYFSEGPYWWPNPAAPNGPYIRRDGEVNPERFTRNHDDLRALCETVLCLASAAVLLGEARYASHAMHLLRVWFVDEPTRMNPNLEFGQAIRGVVWGRGIGLIDTTPFIWLVTAIGLLESSGNTGLPVAVDATVLRGVRLWVSRLSAMDDDQRKRD
jgi:hypothetical protein